MRHRCALPPYNDDPTSTGYTPAEMIWVCSERYCKLQYRLNPTVHRWYRYHP